MSAALDFQPIFAQLNDRPVLVVGGGIVAVRKVKQLLASGAAVTVVAPELNAALDLLYRQGRVVWVAGRFEPAQAGYFMLIVAATNDCVVNREVAAAAKAAFTLCNVVDDLAPSSFIMPAVVNRNPLVVAISTGGASPVLARLIKHKLERALPFSLGNLAKLARRFRNAAKSRFPAIGDRRRFWEGILTGGVADLVHSGREADAEHRLVTALDDKTGPDSRGKAWLVGAGPGDPNLLTLRGAQLLANADVVLHDRLIAEQTLDLARKDAELICVGKAPGSLGWSQSDIQSLLIERVRAGNHVVRLKGGDPLIFGRGGEEAVALQEVGLDVEIVPGLTAATACAARAALPLTARGMALGAVLVSGHVSDLSEDVDWCHLAATGLTLAIYMGVNRCPHIVDELLHGGLPPQTPAAVVASGTTSEQRVVQTNLAQLSDVVRNIPAPALIYVGRALTTSTGWDTRRSETIPDVTFPVSISA